MLSPSTSMTILAKAISGEGKGTEGATVGTGDTNTSLLSTESGKSSYVGSSEVAVVSSTAVSGSGEYPAVDDNLLVRPIAPTVVTNGDSTDDVPPNVPAGDDEEHMFGYRKVSVVFIYFGGIVI